jgi:hypothetical protein
MDDVVEARKDGKVRGRSKPLVRYSGGICQGTGDDGLIAGWWAERAVPRGDGEGFGNRLPTYINTRRKPEGGISERDHGRYGAHRRSTEAKAR